MSGLIFIFLLSTLITQQSDGKHKNRILTAPAYLEPHNKNIYNLYDERAALGNDNEKDFKDETRYEEDRYEDDEEYGSRRLFEWFSRLFKSTTPHAQTIVTTTESVYSKELKERIFLKALHRNLTHILGKLSEIEKHVSYAMDQKEAYAILTKGKPKVLTNSGFYYGDRKKRESKDTADDERQKREAKAAVEGDKSKRDTKMATAEGDSKRNFKIATAVGNKRKRDANRATAEDYTKKGIKVEMAKGDRRKRDIRRATAPGHRRKRETKMVIAKNDRKTYVKTTIAEGNEKKRNIKIATVAGNRRKRETKTTEKSTKTVTEKLEAINVNTTEFPCNITSGRRLGSMPTPTEVKNKLLLYLQESFQEIKGKIMSLRNLKQAFSDNVSFKIGYILANIDTLEVSMLNLKKNMDKNKELWQDNKILELYDTLKVSNQAVSGLIDSLKSYLEKLPYPQVKTQLNFG